MSGLAALRVSNAVVVDVLGTFSTRDVLTMRAYLAQAVADDAVTHVVLDTSLVDVGDRPLGRLIAETAAIACRLGAATTVVGLRPEVADTLADLGHPLRGVGRAQSLKEALAVDAPARLAEAPPVA